MSGEPTNVRRQADRPHYVSIGLSILALTVSGLSWWEAHNARLANEGSNRALAYLTDLKNITPPDKPWPPVYKITIKNFGRSAAGIVTYKIGVGVQKKYSDKVDYQDAKDRVVDFDMPAGHQKEMVLDIPWENIPQPQEGEFRFLFIDLDYIDGPTGKEYGQFWCFKLETSQNGIEPCNEANQE